MFFNNPTNQAVSKNDLKLFFDVSLFLKVLFYIRSEKSTNLHWQTTLQNCHSVCRAVGHFYKELKIIDGKLVGMSPLQNNKTTLLTTNHSWLLTPEGSIIDPYPVGIVSTNGVILIPGGAGAYVINGYNHYVPNAEGEDRDFDLIEAWKRARSLNRTIRKYSTEKIVDQAVESMCH